MFNILKCYTNRLQTTSVTMILRRRYMKVSDKMETLLKQIDNVPRNFHLIYRQQNYKMAGIMYHSVNLVACITVGSVVYSWYTDQHRSADLENFPRFITNPVQGVILFLGICAALGLAMVMRYRYPIRVYVNPKTETYRAIFIGKLPFTSEFHEFTKGSVSYVSENTILPWRTSLFHANGRKILLFEDNFKTQSELHQMLKPETN